MRDFWQGWTSPRPLALLRIGLCLTLLHGAITRWACAIELYSWCGPAMPVELSDLTSWAAVLDRCAASGGVRGVLLHLVWPAPHPLVAVGLASAHIGWLLLAAAGWKTRTSLCLACATGAWLAGLDVAVTFAKDAVIASHLLLLLACSRSQAAWSVDALLDPKRTVRVRLARTGPLRLMQLLLCSIYAGAALTKLQSPAFLQGDLLILSLLDQGWGGGRLAQWISTLPHVPRLLSLAVVLFELLYPCLIWHARLRRPMLLCAGLFHGSMLVLLNIGDFAPLMLVFQLVFVDERDLDWIFRTFRHRHLLNALRPTMRRASHPAALAGCSEPVVPPIGSQPVDCSMSGREDIDDRASELKRAKPCDEILTRHAQRVGWVSRTLRGRRSWFVYGWLVILFVALGCDVQYAMDLYGVFGRRTLPDLATLTPGEAHLLLSPQSWPIESYLFQFELGSRLRVREAFGRERFHHGERALVLTRWLTPHPAVRLEGLLLTIQGREIARFEQSIAGPVDSAAAGFELTSELPAGTYLVVLQADGYEVARKQFELLAD